MSKRRRGPISKRVETLCYGLSSDRINDDTFKQGLKYILDEYGKTGYILQGIGMVVGKWLVQEPKFKDRVWGLANQVDMRIQDLFNKWVEVMKK
jgi:hypothetical protein